MKTKATRVYVSKLRNPYDGSRSVHIAKDGRFTKAEMSVLGRKYRSSTIHFEGCKNNLEFYNTVNRLDKPFFGQKPRNEFEYVRTTYKDNPWYSSKKKSKK